MYAFMQAMGLVNDHVGGCAVRDDAEQSRRAAARSVLGGDTTVDDLYGEPT